MHTCIHLSVGGECTKFNWEGSKLFLGKTKGVQPITPPLAKA